MPRSITGTSEAGLPSSDTSCSPEAPGEPQCQDERNDEKASVQRQQPSGTSSPRPTQSDELPPRWWDHLEFRFSRKDSPNQDQQKFVKAMSMADSTCSIKFGPEWLRVLSDAGGAGGGNSLQNQPGGGSGGSQSSGTPNTISGHHGPPRKYPLAQYRYGKEEMIAIYEQSLYGDYTPPPTMPPGGNGPNLIEGVWVDRSQTPRSLLPMSDDEQRLWAFHRMPTGRGRGRGLGPMGGSGGGGSSSTSSSGWTMPGQGGNGGGQQPIMRSWRSTGNGSAGGGGSASGGAGGGGSSTSQQYNVDRAGPIRDRSGSGTTQGGVCNNSSSSGSSSSNSSGLWRRNSQASQQQQQQHQQPVNNNRDPHQVGGDNTSNSNTGGSSSSSSMTSSNGNNANNSNHNHHNHDSDDNKVPEWADDSLAGSDGTDATDQVGSFDERGGFLGGPPVHGNDRSPLLSSASSGSVRSIHHQSSNIGNPGSVGRQGPHQLQRSLSNVEVTGARTFGREMSSLLVGGYSPEIEPFARKPVGPATVGIAAEQPLGPDTPLASASGSGHPSPLQHSPQAIDDNSQPILSAMVARVHCISGRDSPTVPGAGTLSPAHWLPQCPPIMQPQQTPPRVDSVGPMSSPVIGNVRQQRVVCGDCGGNHTSVAGCPASCGSTMLCGSTPPRPAGGAAAGGTCDMWYYKDPQGVIQGPFTSADMVDWCRQGYFHDGLECRRACDNIFSPLGVLKKAWHGHMPFLAASLLGPINSQFGLPIGTSVHNSQQHMHSVFGGGAAIPMGAGVGGTTMGGLLSGVPNPAHILLSPHSHMDVALASRGSGAGIPDQQIVTSNGIATQHQQQQQEQQSPLVDAHLHHQGPLPLQQLFGSVGGSDVVSLDERQHASMLASSGAAAAVAASVLPGSIPSQFNAHSQSPAGSERLLPVGGVVGAVVPDNNSHSSPLMSSPSRSVASGKTVLSPVRETIQRNMHHDPLEAPSNNVHEQLIAAPPGNALSVVGGGGDVDCDLAAMHVSPPNPALTGINLNGSSRPEDLLLSGPSALTTAATSAWYSPADPARLAPAHDHCSPLDAVGEDLQIQRLQAASDAVRRQVQEKNERNTATISDHSPTSPHHLEQQSPPLGNQSLQQAPLTATSPVNELKKDPNTVPSPPSTTGGTSGSATTAGNKKKKERRDKKAAAAAAAAATAAAAAAAAVAAAGGAVASDKDKTDSVGGSAAGSNNKNHKNRGEDVAQRGANVTVTKESKKQQQQQQQQQEIKEQQDPSLPDWNDDYRVEDQEREPELIVPAPAPAVPAWGARAEFSGDRSSRTPSLGEIQRAEEERALRERAQRQREAARSGCTTAGARTWASAIAPTKSFEQIQKEEASRVIPNHVAAVKSPQSNRSTQPTLMSAAVANGVVPSHQTSRVAPAGQQQQQQQQTPVKSMPVSPSTPVAKTSPPAATKASPVAEVATNEQQLIDWCTQITMGLNSKTYLDIPTVVSILKDVESEAEIEDYVSQFFGESLKEPRQFARQFVQKRARLGVGAASTQPRQPGWCTSSKKNRNNNGTQSNNNNSNNNSNNKASSKKI